MRTDYTEAHELFSDDSIGEVNRFGTLHLASRLISIFLHPLIVPTWLAMILLFIVRVMPLDVTKLWIITGLITSFTLFIPLLGIFIMFKMGILKDKSLTTRSERLLPMFFTSICFIMPQIVFFDVFNFSRELTALLLAMTLCVVAGGIITLWYKISAHAISIGGVFAITLFAALRLNESYMLWPLLLVLLASGALLSARLFLQVHSMLQVLSGWILGFSIASIISWYFL